VKRMSSGQTGLLIQIWLAGVGIQYVGEVKPAGVPSALVGLRRGVPVPGLKRKYEPNLEMTRPTCSNSKSMPSRQRHNRRYE
jgi:hypothetical protein